MACFNFFKRLRAWISQIRKKKKQKKKTIIDEASPQQMNTDSEVVGVPPQQINTDSQAVEVPPLNQHVEVLLTCSLTLSLIRLDGLDSPNPCLWAGLPFFSLDHLDIALPRQCIYFLFYKPDKPLWVARIASKFDLINTNWISKPTALLWAVQNFIGQVYLMPYVKGGYRTTKEQCVQERLRDSYVSSEASRSATVSCLFTDRNAAQSQYTSTTTSGSETSSHSSSVLLDEAEEQVEENSPHADPSQDTSTASTGSGTSSHPSSVFLDEADAQVEENSLKTDESQDTSTASGSEASSHSFSVLLDEIKKLVEGSSQQAGESQDTNAASGSKTPSNPLQSSGFVAGGHVKGASSATAILAHAHDCVKDDFVYLKVLGKGSFGKVLLADKAGLICAVKVVKKTEALKNVLLSMVERDVLLLAKDSLFLTSLIASFQTNDYLFFVMEYQSGGTLDFHIKATGRLDINRTTFYAAEMIVGLQFLHSKGVIHRDLKPANVMLDSEGHVRIADFGLCAENMFGERKAKCLCGTRLYMAPEMVKRQAYTFSVDWWSFGVTVYEMLTGLLPFMAASYHELEEAILSHTPHYPLFVTMDTKDLLNKLFERDPGFRLGVVGDIRSHDIFGKLNWAILERREMEPPFKPKVEDHKNCSYRESQSESGFLSSIASISPLDQAQFHGFSYYPHGL